MDDRAHESVEGENMAISNGVAASAATEPNSREELLIDMAEIAARRALASAGRDASEIDTIIAASSSDNDAFPTTAGLLQLRLGCGTIRTTTLKGACACQTEAFQVCSEILATNSAKLVLMVAS